MTDATQYLIDRGYDKLAALSPETADRAQASAKALLSRLPENPDPVLEPTDITVPDDGAST